MRQYSIASLIFISLSVNAAHTGATFSQKGGEMSNQASPDGWTISQEGRVGAGNATDKRISIGTESEYTNKSVGYDPFTGKDIDGSQNATISIGNGNYKRQIKNVENGIDDYDAVNVSQLKAVSNSASEAISIVNNANTSINQAVNIANSLNDTVSKGINIGADNGPVVKRELGDTVTVTGDSNIRTKTTSTGVKVALNQNINLGENGSVNTGNTTVNSHGVIINEGPSMTRSGFNAANNRITNVAPGINNTDAVNVGQLNNVVSNVGKSIQNLNNRINHVEKNANAGIAEAMATAGLPQAYLPGKSMMAIGGGSYSGETGYAIGYSTISDNGRWMFKGTGSGNSRGNYGGTLGVGYQW